MEELIKMLRETGCSLIVRTSEGDVSSYDKKGVRDLIWLLDNHPARLQGAWIADKVVGKAAAGLLVNGKVEKVYAEVMSQLALPLLDAAGISYSYGQLVSRIIIPEGDQRCPLEQIVTEARTAQETEEMLRKHFAEQQAARNKIY